MAETTDALLLSTAGLPQSQPTPFAIAKARAQELTEQTDGVLVGEVSTTTNDNATMIRMRLVVPAMGGFRQGILTAIHPNGRDYPVWIHASCFPRSLSVPPYAILTPEQENEDFVAHNADEFRHLVEKVMSSDDMARDIAWLTTNARQGEPEEP